MNGYVLPTELEWPPVTKFNTKFVNTSENKPDIVVSMGGSREVFKDVKKTNLTASALKIVNPTTD